MVYEDEEPDVRDPNYDEAAQVRLCLSILMCSHLNMCIFLSEVEAQMSQMALGEEWDETKYMLDMN